MASGGIEGDNSNIPQWKRDLIQRRRQQQNKSLHNGVKVNDCNSTKVFPSGYDQCNDLTDLTISAPTIATTLRGKSLDNRENVDDGSLQVTTVVELLSKGNASGANVTGGMTTSTSRESSGSGSDGVFASSAVASAPKLTNSVVSNMRLDVGLSMCSTLDETPKITAKNNINHLINSSSTFHGQFDGENLRDINNMKTSGLKNNKSDNKDTTGVMTMGNKSKDTCVYTEFYQKNINRILSNDNNKAMSSNRKSCDDCESDSSEELQYGPGIVNKLRSKYLNLTLREMNKTRASVQRFRRAASLENLLDCHGDSNDDDNEDYDDNNEDSGVGYCNDEKYDKDNDGEQEHCDASETDKVQRKFMRKTIGIGVAAKTERYRNAMRGKDSIKRARSVETLMRYQTPIIDDVKSINSTGKASLLLKQQKNNDPNDDHIVLIDQTSIKIESRLSDCEQLNNQRTKFLNKPKRLKPLLAETERPPTDLVKTTMKIFEGSVRKLKPKGEVAIKVATFKTINDTFKAQTMKKCIPKPPIQPKPFVNGISAKLVSPKKIIPVNMNKNAQYAVEKKNSTENEMKQKNDGVITDPIIQSVSSVVSKFQQIEKSQSPSPDSNLSHKIKYSPVPSPEPPQLLSSTSSASAVTTQLPLTSSIINRQKSIVDGANSKSPPTTPRISSPLIPPLIKKDITQSGLDDNKSNNDDLFNLDNKVGMVIDEKTQEKCHDSYVEISTINNETMKQSEIIKKKNFNNDIDNHADDNDKRKDNDVDKYHNSDHGKKFHVEVVDSPRTISKLALDNISKAGSSIKFNFDAVSCEKKNYLPGMKLNSKNLIKTSVEKSFDNDRKLPRVRDELSSNGKCEGVVENLESSFQNDNLGTSSIGFIKSTAISDHEAQKLISNVKNTKETVAMPQKQIGIIRPLVTTKVQQITQQQNLSDRELEKNLINRVKSIEQPTKLVVSIKNTDEIQLKMRKNCGSIDSGSGGDISGGGSGGLWDTKPWNQQDNTMVFNFSARKDVPDYIENDGLIIRRKREKTKTGDGGIIVLDATIDASTTDDNDWEISVGPPSPCDVSFVNDNILINGRSNLSKSPRHHKNRIQFDDTATRMFEYPSEASMLEDENLSVDGEIPSSTIEQEQLALSKIGNKSHSTNTANIILGSGSLASFTPSKVDLVSEAFELGITKSQTGTSSTLMVSTATTITTTTAATSAQQERLQSNQKILCEVKSSDETDDKNTSETSSQDAAAWSTEATTDLLY